MITLKTLNEASEQEVFDQVAEHLLTQMARSENDEHCLYRGPDGLKCAAGCLIADSEYNADMDGLHGVGWHTFIEKHNVTNSHKDLINRLQFVHDHYLPDMWLGHLRRVAKAWGLNDSVLDKFGKKYE